DRGPYEPADLVGILHAFAEPAFQERMESFAGIEPAARWVEADADVHAAQAFRKNPAIVRFHDGVEVNLHGVGNPFHVLVPSQNGMQSFSRAVGARERVMSAAAAD